VADDPGSWADAVAAARDDIETGGFEQGVVADVPRMVWRLVLCGPSPPLRDDRGMVDHLARRTLAVAQECIDGASTWAVDDVDPWACLRSALLDWGVVSRLPAVAERRDIALLEELSHQLAAPADVVCLDLVAELGEPAA
jgi:hypothetical protein